MRILLAVERREAHVGEELAHALVDRRFALDIDQPQRLRPYRHAHHQEDRNVGNLYLLRYQPGDCADRQDGAAGKQNLFCNFNGGCFLHLKSPDPRKTNTGAARFLFLACEMLPDTI